MAENEVVQEQKTLQEIMAEAMAKAGIQGDDGSSRSYTMEENITPTQLMYAAVGRVVRAVTYPVIANEYPDMTLRELNALATVAHVGHQARVGKKAPKGCTAVTDTSDGMRLVPGAGQAFWTDGQYAEAFQGLAVKGLVTLKESTGPRFHQTSPEVGSIVTMTKAGRELIKAIGGNLGKSLSTLDNPTARAELLAYAD